ncbi:MAG: antibiotic biosynthesis monooxygenase [Alphaproteobacteria bacterium]|nr:antibiotic biosynthesis monooxygenase [Alphaproteobacteria bacterium]
MALGIIATLKVQDGKQTEFEAAFAEMAKVVKAEEKGCLLYSLCRDQEDNTTYRVMEQYTDDAALAAHGKSDAFKAAAGALGGGIMAAKPDLIYVDVV